MYSLLAQILKNNMIHARNICTFIELRNTPFVVHTFLYLFFLQMFRNVPDTLSNSIY